MPGRALLTLTLLLIAAVAGCATATGSAIVTGERRPPVAPETVRLYASAPAEFETIAIVKASSDSGWTEQDDVDYAVEELKKQAAKVGANGVLVEAAGTETQGTVAIPMYGGGFIAVPSQAATVQGRAIFVLRDK
jgi:hypothetical protein